MTDEEQLEDKKKKNVRPASPNPSLEMLVSRTLSCIGDYQGEQLSIILHS